MENDRDYLKKIRPIFDLARPRVLLRNLYCFRLRPMNRQIEMLQNMIRCTVEWRNNLRAMKARGACADSTMIDGLIQVAEGRIASDQALVESIRKSLKHESSRLPDNEG